MRIDERFEKVDARFDQATAKIDRITSRIDALNRTLLAFALGALIVALIVSQALALRLRRRRFTRGSPSTWGFDGLAALLSVAAASDGADHLRTDDRARRRPATSRPEEPVVPRRSPLRAAIKTGRPKEWIKNVFVFAGLLFSGKFYESHEVLLSVVTFASFCLISSAGYFVNDLIDVELDRKHPKKRFRPLAAGELLEGAAKAIAPVLAVVAIAVAFAFVNWEVGLMVVGYGVAQMAYSLGLKQIVIIDVMTLAGLFILRVAAGASAVDAHASEWLILCTGMLAAFLGFTKRRQEAVSELHEGTATRSGAR